MNPLEISGEEFRRLGTRAVEIAAQFLDELNQLPTFPHTTGAETESRFNLPLPVSGKGAAALEDVAEVLRHSRPPSPRFYGYVLGSGEPVAAIADLLASVLNQNVTAWRSAPAAASIERATVSAVAEAIGCRGFQGTLCGGGSAANLMGVAMAREARLPANETGVRPGVVYASEEIHMSIGKAVALLGLGRQNLRLVPVDSRFRLMPEALENAIQEEERAGRRGIVVVASAGTVNTGAIDPLSEVARIARRHGLWLHVDGAYGALAAIAAPQKFPGLAEADSISLDAHKWLYQPLDCGCLLYRDAAAASKAFSHTGDYARALSGDPIEGYAFFEESIELSRRFRALKLWLSMGYHGLDAFRRAIADDLRRARLLAERIAEMPELELLAPVELSAVCFRHVGVPGSEQKLDELNTSILQRIIARGRVYISNATLRGCFALRACVVNHRATDADVLEVVDEVLAAARELIQE
ncbi:MAG: aminotransferase class V-fold PLP-dependent enzyme [Acidobacteria bacterium]|nr:aminotransferase class V-fold PLP-dependent enzyme [Acidobacteriota bacterium]